MADEATSSQPEQEPELHWGISYLREDIQDLRTEMRDSIKDVRAEIDTVRTEMREGFDAVRAEMQSVRAELRSELREFKIETNRRFEELAKQMNTQFRFLMTTMVGLAVVVVAVIKM